MAKKPEVSTTETATEVQVGSEAAAPVKTMSSISAQIPVALHRALKISTIESGITMSSIVTEALQDWLDGQPKK
jgi:hypothetical protein